VEAVEAAVREDGALAMPVMEVPETGMDAGTDAESLAMPVMEVPETGSDAGTDEGEPSDEERAALQDLMDRMREAPPPDLSVPDPDGDND
jgi:hypothetical protein